MCRALFPRIVCLWLAVLLPAGSFAQICAGAAAPAARRAQVHGVEHGAVVAIFARFADSPPAPVPAWSEQIFSGLPGSFNHYYAEMSFGRHLVTGEAVGRWYSSSHPAADYTAATSSEFGDYARFAHEVLVAADADVDFSRFDNDGPDGVPDSGDDDGVVDAVFILLPQVPHGFILGAATGVGQLGWDDTLHTNDVGHDGRRIQIQPERGILGRAASLNEAVGMTCHEYGHVLGLHDLYNTDYLRDPEATPPDDSAGIGAWGLMGWGAAGWHGDDGPNPLSAWSRVALGWATVRDVTGSEEIFVEDVGRHGVVYRASLTRREYFLLESRARGVGSYDRQIPGEGLLIWRVTRTLRADSTTSRWVVDLECADGRWSDAGYPVGMSAAPRDGGDNLDFWAHDEAYRNAHAGNLGDATDPFFGGASFTPDTNPSSAGTETDARISVEDIRRDGEGMRARVTTEPMLLVFDNLSAVDDQADGAVVAGEGVSVRFAVVNEGGLRANDVHVRLRTEDPHVELLADSTHLGDIRIGSRAVTSSTGYPRLRIRPGFTGTRSVRLILDLIANGGLVGQEELVVPVSSPQLRLSHVETGDAGGQGGAMAAEVVTPALILLEPLQEGVFSAGLRSLTPGVELLGSPRLVPEGSRLSGPSILIPAQPPDSLRLEVTVGTAFYTWRDTLALPVAAGPDRTPPVVDGVRVSRSGGDVDIFVANAQIHDASPIGQVRAAFAAEDGAPPVAELELQAADGGFGGSWEAAVEGALQVRVLVTDIAGNEGASPAVVVPDGDRIPTASQSGWRLVPVVDDGGIPTAWRDFAFDPKSPDVVLGLTEEGIWRREPGDDGEVTWRRLPLMLPSPATGLYFAHDAGSFWVSTPRLGTWGTRDEGRTWQPLTLAGGDTLLAVGPDGALWAGSPDGLFVSRDTGRSWQRSHAAATRWVGVSPADPDRVYSRTYSWQGAMQGSVDGGITWMPCGASENLKTPAVSLVDGRIYGAVDGELLVSSDGCQTWSALEPPPIARSSSSPWLLTPTVEGPVVWSREDPAFARSADGGRSWTRHPFDSWLPAGIAYVNPGRPEEAYVITNSTRLGTTGAWHLDAGRWESVDMPRTRRPAGVVAPAEDRRLVVGVGENLPGGGHSGGAYKSWEGDVWEAYGQLDNWSLPTEQALIISGWWADPLNPVQVLSYMRYPLAGNLGTSSRLLAYGAMLDSRDGGRTWARAAIDFSRLRLSQPQPQGAALRGAQFLTPGDGSLWRQLGDNEPWRRVDLGVDGGDGVTAIAANALAIDAVFACTGTPPDDITDPVATSLLWRSTDGGNSWERVGSSLPMGPVVRLTVLPSGDILALTPRALMASADGGSTWQVRGQYSEDDGIDRRLRLHPTDSERFLLSAGARLLLSDDGGRSWSSLPGPEGVSFYNDAAFMPTDPRRIVAATPWGVYVHDQGGAGVTAVEGTVAVPMEVSLGPAYPNPFNPSVTVPFTVARGGEVDVAVYDLLGQRIVTLAQRAVGGAQAVVWDGRDATGRTVGTGVYFVQLRVEGRRQTQKVLLLR